MEAAPFCEEPSWLRTCGHGKFLRADMPRGPDEIVRIASLITFFQLPTRYRSGIRPEYKGAPRKFEEEEPKPSSTAQIHATFRNTKKDPRFEDAELYYDESGFFGKIGWNDGPIAVNTFSGKH